ncbi:MAG: hypothetical protein EZS28_037620 [Streblomastix strix]|uniref:Uncharacterized protein n=1 Tax=Streblomastix strix TaxID=222440 RepID=A0A5J4U9I2_9EUKA|nr:MAG: hypothetical protein EZS28_037620 [Streblomastix strix]
MEEGRLGMLAEHQINVQSCGSNRRVRELPSVYTQGNTLYASENAFRDLNSTEDLCKDNINNNRQSKKQESSPDSELCRRHSVPDTGLTIARERNRMDSVEIQEIWIGDQREQKQIKAGLAICVTGMDVQLSNNGDLANLREKEGIEGTSSKIDKTNNVIKASKDKKRGKFGWQASIFHSISQTRRTTSIANKQANEQSNENNGLDERNDSNGKVFDRAILEDKSVGEQQAKGNRQEIELDNNIYGRINCRKGSECDQEQRADQKDIRRMRSGDGKFQLERNTGDIEGSSKTDNTTACFSTAKAKAKYHLRKADRFDFINRRGKLMDINNKTYCWEIEQRSGRFIKVVDGGGLFNKEGNIIGGFKGLVSWDNSGFMCSKKQRQTQEILQIGEGQKSERMILNESLLGGGVCINTPTDTNNKQSNKENSRGESSRNNDSSKLARISLVDVIEGNNSEREGIGREREGIRDGIEDEEEESESSSGEDIGFRGKRDNMEQDYFETLQKHPDYQEIQLDLQQITGMEVGEDTPVRQQPFVNI